MLDIATAANRHATAWKNKKIQWADFLKRISTTARTPETVEQYKQMPKAEQDDIKDVGGYVFGYLEHGRRKAQNVRHRQAVCLDVDFTNNMEIWDDFVLEFDCAAALYSTHKHTPESPRLRIIIPLSRTVSPDEYEAVARRIASKLDIERFDPTTFQPVRLMYFPSTSVDGEYIYMHQEGSWLDPDKILAEYVDWTDASEWAVSEKVDLRIRRGLEKQGDPGAKAGVIGAFCRTYDVPAAIAAFLPDTYTPTDSPERYSFAGGSTAGGLVIYDDGAYGFSHHGSDPAGSRLCNAFDLVRLHTYGDTEASLKEMLDMAAADRDVQGQMAHDRLAEAKMEFADEDWVGQLAVTKTGAFKPTIGNVALILENDPGLKGAFSRDDFRREKLVVSSTPWREVKETSQLRDEDEQNLTKYLEATYGISNRMNIKDAFDTHLDACAFHPVREYLESLPAWDGTERLSNLLIDYIGAAPTEYVREVTKKSFVACVARIMRPGCKFDNMLTLIGSQGIGKSTLFAVMGGEWFTDSFNFNMLHSKEAYEQIQGAWMVEVGELSGLRKAEVEPVKQFISKREDSFRPAYGRNKVTAKRQCVMFGTTNTRDFLRDYTGNRRFWAVEAVAKAKKSIWKELASEREQLWAEALHLYNSGEQLNLSPEMEKVAEEVALGHLETDERQGMIERYLSRLLPLDWNTMDIYSRRAYLHGEGDEGVWQRAKVCAAEIWSEALGGNDQTMTRQNTKEIHQMMRHMDGWEELKTKTRFGQYGVQRGYILRQQSTATNGSTATRIKENSNE